MHDDDVYRGDKINKGSFPCAAQPGKHEQFLGAIAADQDQPGVTLY